MSERRKTILVVDDDEEMRETLTAGLKRDYRVLRAATGEVGLQMMEKEDVDLMLLDVRLPGISGFEVLKITKENYPYVEVIVISAVKELEAAIEAMRHGAYHYISKDFDLEGVRALVANLITNSLQATPPSGHVVVRTSREDGHAVVEVTDTGYGIPKERLPTIFDDFVTTKRRGLGLGLAISKKVVEQLDGTIAVQSEVGVGSTFTLRFPLTKARPSKLVAAV